MSNILIIKHGSLGDIAQASGAIQDIFENHANDKIFILTTKPYIDLFKSNPCIHEVILDKRQPRYNLIYLFLLMKKIKSYNFTKIYDLQNSSRTVFYKRILHPKSNSTIWSSSETTIPGGKTKDEFDQNSVLNRFEHQLKISGIKTKNTLYPNFLWSCKEISKIKSEYNLSNYILLFPFCSPHLHKKKWPYYNDLISRIKKSFKDKYKIVVAPGPKEINDAKSINANCILDNGKPLSISQLSSLIVDSNFVIANDTGPAHMTAHLNSKGIALFGSHTTAKKVSIERDNFKVIQVSDLKKLSSDKVFERIKNFLD